MSQFQLKRILCPTDFSANSQHALEFACALVDQFQADLHVLHVLPVDMIQAMADPYVAYGMPSNLEERMRASAERTLAEIPDSSWAGNQRVVRSLRHGSPFVEIVKYARENNIDLIVLGTHGRSGLSHVLLGSVAENVVRKAGCPVLTVRAPDHEFLMP